MPASKEGGYQFIGPRRVRAEGGWVWGGEIRAAVPDCASGEFKRKDDDE